MPAITILFCQVSNLGGRKGILNNRENTEVKTDRVIKIIAAICFVLIAVALFVIRDSPATAYEASIYKSTPPLVWGCLLFSIASGIGIIVHQVHSRREHNNLWIIGYVLILLITFIILSLHILRGYALWCAAGDPGSHLGWIQDIIAAGHAEQGAVYPITHLLLAQISQVSGISPILLHKWIPVLFGLLSVGSMFFLARSLLPQKRQVIIAALAGSSLNYLWYLNLTPNHLSTLLFPLAVYLLVRSFSPGTWQWKMLFLSMLFLFPPFHPVAAIALFIVVATLWLPGRIWRPAAQKLRTRGTNAFRFSIIPALLFAAWSIVWFSSTYAWKGTVRGFYQRITTGEGSYYIEYTVAQIQEGAAYGFSVMEAFFKVYGVSLLYLILAAVILPWLLRKLQGEERFEGAVSLYAPIAIIGTLMAVSYFFNLFAFNPARLLAYVTILLTIPAGLALSQFMDWTSLRRNWLAKLAPFVIAILLIVISIHGILRVYPSPYMNGLNSQTTKTEIEGLDWFFHRKDVAKPISWWRICPSRFAAFLLTPGERQEISASRYVPEDWEVRPQHFGYDKHSMIGQSYDKDAYLILNQMNKIAYTDIYPELAEAGALPEDFATLENDPSVDKLYSNTGFDAWYVHARD